MLITGSSRRIAPGHCAVVGRNRERVAVHLLSTHARDSIVLRSDFVEAIQHFAARPQYYTTQPEDQKGGHFLDLLLAAGASYAAASRSMSSA